MNFTEKLKWLSERTDMSPEGVTFSLHGYESVTGQWSLTFECFDGFAPFISEVDYIIWNDSFLEDIEKALDDFINKKYPLWKEIS